MSIVQNKKAFHDYFIEERYETGLVLEGWEVKAIRAGRVQLKEAYVIIRNAELFLIGCHISPLLTASTHVQPDPVRTRKLLLHAEEIKQNGDGEKGLMALTGKSLADYAHFTNTDILSARGNSLFIHPDPLLNVSGQVTGVSLNGSSVTLRFASQPCR